MPYRNIVMHAAIIPVTFTLTFTLSFQYCFSEKNSTLNIDYDSNEKSIFRSRYTSGTSCAKMNEKEETEMLFSL